MKTALTSACNLYKGLPDATLSGCANDNHDWNESFFARGIQPTIQTDHNATRKAILDQLTKSVAELKKGDLFVFQFSGHGTWVVDQDGDEDDRRDEAICPYDLLDSGPITDDELYAIFETKAYGSRIVFISDSCHSGTLARFAPAQWPIDGQAVRIRYLPPSVWLNDQNALKVASRSIATPFKGRSRMGGLVLAGCADSEYSYDAWFAGRANGAFTYSALKALNEIAPISYVRPSSSSSSPGIVTYKSWMKAIRTKLPSVSYPQTPQLSGTVGQFNWPVLQ